MSSVIQDPRVGQLLQNVFGLQGRMEFYLENGIVPTLTVGDLGRGAQPPVVRRATAAFRQAAVAAERFTARFEIPGNMIALITKMNIVPATGVVRSRAKFSSVGAALASTASKSLTDGRLIEVGQAPAGVLTFGTRATSITDEWRGVADNTGGLTYEPGWVIGSGKADQFGFFEFQVETTNLEVFGSLEWIEYQLV